MEFGIFVDFDIPKGMTQSQTFDMSFKVVEEADRLDIDSVWLAEVHFSPYCVLSSPMVVASSVATRTKRIRVGLAVQVLPLANPLRAAEEAATLDHISKGRFDFGIGRSGITKYYQGYNVPYAESRGRFLEALEIITKAWGDGPFSHQGEHFSFHNVNVQPKPYQKPHPPLCVAVAAADTFSLMGSMGHPIFISANTETPLLQERLAEYRKARGEAGHSGPGKVMLRIPAYVAETAARAHSDPEASALQMIRYGANEQTPFAASQETADRFQRMAATSYDELLRWRLMYGTPEYVVDRLHQYEETFGITGVVLEMNYGGQVPHDRVINSLRLLSEKVMPNLR